MTQTKITLSYEEICDFSQPTVITMEVPERGIDEMCEYFQRFLSAAGYLFEDDDRIRCVSTNVETPLYPASAIDILTFNQEDTPFVYDFNEGSTPPSGIDGSYYMGVRGGMAEDIIKFD